MTDEKKKSSRAATPPPKDRGCLFFRGSRILVVFYVVQYSMVPCFEPYPFGVSTCSFLSADVCILGKASEANIVESGLVKIVKLQRQLFPWWESGNILSNKKRLHFIFLDAHHFG